MRECRWASRNVRKLCGTIAADAVTRHDLKADIEFFGQEILGGADTKATSKGRVIVSKGRARCCGAVAGDDGRSCWGREILRCSSGNRAWIDAIAKVREDSEEFVVAKTGIDGYFDEEIRKFVDSVSRWVEGIEKTSAHTRSIEEEILVRGDAAGCRRIGVGAEATTADGGLRSFDGNRHGNVFVEDFGYTESASTLPGESHHVVWVDHHGE